MSFFASYPVNGITGFGSIQLLGSTSGSLALTVPAVVTSYTLTFPAAQGGANTILQNDGSGNLSWVSDTSPTLTLTNAHIFVGNVSNVATDVAVSGDLTLANTGAFSIGAGKVTNTMLAGSIADTNLLTISTAGKVSDSALPSSMATKTFTGITTFPGSTSIDASGNALIGQVLTITGSTSITAQVSMNGTTTLGAGTQRAFEAIMTGTTAGTGIQGFVAELTTGASSTVTNASQFFSSAFTIGASGSVTRFMAFRDAKAASHPATNNAAFCDNAAFTGNWFINQSGTDASTLAGALTIGGATVLGSTVRLNGASVANGSVASVFTPVSGPTGAATAIQGWLKINVSGTDHYIPYW